MQQKKSYLVSLVTLGILFFIFGFVTWLNGSLIPFLKIACELTTFQALLVTFAFYISYFVMALPSSYVLKKVGFLNGMSIGLLIMALGSLIFIPAAYSRQYWVFLSGLFIQGTGLALLQTAVNPYVTIIGPEESAAKRISIMGICNKAAGVLSPIILGAIILKDAGKISENINHINPLFKSFALDELAQRVILPYIIMAAILFGLAIMIKYVHLPKIEPFKSERLSTNAKTSIFHFPQLIFGVMAIFLYVGAEVIAGDTIVIYGQSQGISLDIARLFTSYTLTAMIVGYVAGILLIPKIINQSKALFISALSGILFSILALLTSGFTSVMCIALLGLSNAIMWPAIWPLSISGLGEYTEKGSALLIMGILGGAILPPIYGLLVQANGFNHQIAYIILVPMYIFILFFAAKGHKIRSW
jgi:glucose/galactose transporter